MNMLDVRCARGSLWHRWHPHIHTPGTALNNQYRGPTAWNDCLQVVEASDPPIGALGITDYCSIDQYEQVVEHRNEGRLGRVGLIFQNVEFRLSIETTKASALNLHLLFSPDGADHVEQIKRFLLGLEFIYAGGPYRCERLDLVRLGRACQPDVSDETTAYAVGVNQFKVNLDQLEEAWTKNDWVNRNGRLTFSASFS